MSPYKRETPEGWFEFSDGETWFDERYVCQHCADEREEKGLPFAWADEQYSFGCYAGRYCDACWPKSGFRDAVDPDAEFDPAYAGERIDEDY